jgi:hypothetical protein
VGVGARGRRAWAASPFFFVELVHKVSDDPNPSLLLVVNDDFHEW